MRNLCGICAGICAGNVCGICAGNCAEFVREKTRIIGEAFGDMGRPGRPFGKLSHIIFIFMVLHSQIECVT